MKRITLEVPDQTYEHLKSVAQFEDNSFEHFAKEILILAEREIWKTHGRKTEEMLRGFEYFNTHLR